MIPEMLQRYRKVAMPALAKRLGCTNPHQVPTLEKIVVATCVGSQPDRKQAIEDASAEIALITGQRAALCKSKQAVSNFKLRAGETIGAKVTLRGPRMWEFLQRLVVAAIPRLRDFRGLSRKSFDGAGNYTLGIADHSIFPEIELDKVKRSIGFDVTIVTTAHNNADGMALLEELGLPFRKTKEQQQAEEAAAAAAKS